MPHWRRLIIDFWCKGTVLFWNHQTKSEKFLLFLEKFLFFLVFRAFRGLYIIIYIRHSQASGHRRKVCSSMSEHGQASRTAAEGVRIWANTARHPGQRRKVCSSMSGTARHPGGRPAAYFPRPARRGGRKDLSVAAVGGECRGVWDAIWEKRPLKSNRLEIFLGWYVLRKIAQRALIYRKLDKEKRRR